MRPLANILNEQFRKHYRATRRVSIDESMILFNGRSSLKQYNPMKPIKRGYKIWCLADKNGYISNFDVYQGKNKKLEEEFENFGLGGLVVLSLSKADWYKHKILYADNYFTSIKLLEELRINDTLACGTIKSRRQWFPKVQEDEGRW